MDSLQQQIPIIREVQRFIPLWVWPIILWFLFTFLLKPYTDAIVRLYQPFMDQAARKTTKAGRRVLVEILRLLLISGQLVGLIHFLVTPKSKRLRVFRKNEIVYYLWLLSSSFPNRRYYLRVRSWFERTVYLDPRTSYTFPEPLKGDDTYFEQTLAQDLAVTHQQFIDGLREGDWHPIVRVGFALTRIDPRKWMGKRRFLISIIFAWVQSLLVFGAFPAAFWSVKLAATAFILGVIMFAVDRRILNRLIITTAISDGEFFSQAIKTRAIQLNW